MPETITTPVRKDHADRLVVENTRLHRALRALYTRDVHWLKKRKVNAEGIYRIGVYDLKAEQGPSLISIYSRKGFDPLIRVMGARPWAEEMLLDRNSWTDELLRNLATEVLRFLGEREL